MDATNLDILQQLKEYAQLYFDAIVELNTVNGVCTLAAGKYSAKEMSDNSYKCVFGHAYMLPEDEIFDEDITLQSSTFKCKFPYRRVFIMLSNWETMCKAGKLKAVFEIGSAEIKSAKVLLNENTELGTFKTKSMKLQHVEGNWWRPAKLPKIGNIELVYNINGIHFMPGLKFDVSVIKDNPEYVAVKCAKHGDDFITKSIRTFIGRHDNENSFCAYINEVADRAGIELPTIEEVKPTQEQREEIKQ